MQLQGSMKGPEEGDMLFGRRVGFSGTPSDLHPSMKFLRFSIALNANLDSCTFFTIFSRGGSKRPDILQTRI